MRIYDEAVLRKHLATGAKLAGIDKMLANKGRRHKYSDEVQIVK